MLALPLKLFAGVNVMVPSALSATLPCVGSSNETLPTASCAAGVSTSASFALTSIVTAVLIGVLATSATATGASSRPSMVTVSDAATV